MPQDADWSAFLADVELTELKLAGVFGQVRELVDSDEGDLPAEWKVEVSRAHLVDESQIRIRVIAEAEGPGGRLVVDGLGVFAASRKLDEVKSEIVERFVAETGVAAVIPTVRASFEDLNQRLELGAPKLRLIRLAPYAPTTNAESS